MNRNLALTAACLLLASCADVLGGSDRIRGNFSNALYQESQTSPKNPDGSGGVTCVTTYSVSGFVEVEVNDAGAVSGKGTAEFVEGPISVAPNGCGMGPNRKFDVEGPITGSNSSFSFAGDHNSTGALNVNHHVTFSGSLSASGGSGTLTLVNTGTGVGNFAGHTSSGSMTVTVTLAR